MSPEASSARQIAARQELAALNAPMVSPVATSVEANPSIEDIFSLSAAAFPELAVEFTRTRPASPYDKYTVNTDGTVVEQTPTEVHDVLTGSEEKQVVLAEGYTIQFTYYTVDTFDSNGIRLSRTYVPDAPELPVMRERITGFLMQGEGAQAYPAGQDYTSSVVSPDGTEHEVSQRSFFLAKSVTENGAENEGSWYKQALAKAKAAHIEEGMDESAAEEQAAKDLALPERMRKQGSVLVRVKDSKIPQTVRDRTGAFRPDFGGLQTDAQRKALLTGKFGAATFEEVARNLTPQTDSEFPFPRFVIEPQEGDSHAYILCAVDISPDNGPTFNVAGVNRSTNRIDTITQVYLGTSTPAMSVYRYGDNSEVNGRDEWVGDLPWDAQKAGRKPGMTEEVVIEDGKRVYYQNYNLPSGDVRRVQVSVLGDYTPEA